MLDEHPSSKAIFSHPRRSEMQMIVDLRLFSRSMVLTWWGRRDFSLSSRPRSAKRFIQRYIVRVVTLAFSAAHPTFLAPAALTARKRMVRSLSNYCLFLGLLALCQASSLSYPNVITFATPARVRDRTNFRQRQSISTSF